MKNFLKYPYLWIVVWILITVAAIVDISVSSSIIDILTIILGISMIYYNYDSYRKMIPKNGKNGRNGDMPYG